jgi:deoxyribodipyrimidine photo-lyase
LGPKADDKISSLPLPTLAHWHLPAPTAQILPSGERAARDRMKHFIDSGILKGYTANRNTPAGQTTSLLSQDLRYGLIGIRELYARCAAVEAGSTYIKELAWREFYFAILWFYPKVFEHEFAPDWRGLPWPGTDADFQRWATGTTGFPIVDAGMRQLLQTGLMHNRLRMITAMFLTKDLHCDWRLGEAFFMQQLVDGENASNNGGWQWSAGTGADAAPYFRIQNPWLQSARFDPQGVYIKQWVPELKDVPAPLLHEPPKPGLRLAKGYPLPMVDHHTERDRCLAIFAKHKAGAELRAKSKGRRVQARSARPIHNTRLLRGGATPLCGAFMPRVIRFCDFPQIAFGCLRDQSVFTSRDNERHRLRLTSAPFRQ